MKTEVVLKSSNGNVEIPVSEFNENRSCIEIGLEIWHEYFQ